MELLSELNLLFRDINNIRELQKYYEDPFEFIIDNKKNRIISINKKTKQIKYIYADEAGQSILKTYCVGEYLYLILKNNNQHLNRYINIIKTNIYVDTLHVKDNSNVPDKFGLVYTNNSVIISSVLIDKYIIIYFNNKSWMGDYGKYIYIYDILLNEFVIKLGSIHKFYIIQSNNLNFLIFTNAYHHIVKLLGKTCEKDIFDIMRFHPMNMDINENEKVITILNDKEIIILDFKKYGSKEFKLTVKID